MAIALVRDTGAIEGRPVTRGDLIGTMQSPVGAVRSPMAAKKELVSFSCPDPFPYASSTIRGPYVVAQLPNQVTT